MRTRSGPVGRLAVVAITTMGLVVVVAHSAERPAFEPGAPAASAAPSVRAAQASEAAAGPSTSLAMPSGSSLVVPPAVQTSTLPPTTAPIRSPTASPADGPPIATHPEPDTAAPRPTPRPTPPKTAVDGTAILFSEELPPPPPGVAAPALPVQRQRFFAADPEATLSSLVGDHPAPDPAAGETELPAKPAALTLFDDQVVRFDTVKAYGSSHIEPASPDPQSPSLLVTSVRWTAAQVNVEGRDYSAALWITHDDQKGYRLNGQVVVDHQTVLPVTWSDGDRHVLSEPAPLPCAGTCPPGD